MIKSEQKKVVKSKKLINKHQNLLFKNVYEILSGLWEKYFKEYRKSYQRKWQKEHKPVK